MKKSNKKSNNTGTTSEESTKAEKRSQAGADSKGGVDSSRGVDSKIIKRQRWTEVVATAGLTIVALAMILPFATGLEDSLYYIGIYKWVYAFGAVLYTGARLVNVNAPGDSLRLKRLRRLEFWAGMAFCIGAFLLFYHCNKYHIDNPAAAFTVGPLAVLRDTILFSLVGALIQLIASWMIAFRMRKER
ncbi:MAG: hypothetical protein NC097_01320 [Clostridium sp.]|nr:hypothetical protein [Prevotella sp.]MCM1428421.1 hypothetical protein [Clostridium sp.]MCM1474886.1 hypothetical protein [Muribaculaceae bacterium]